MLLDKEDEQRKEVPSTVYVVHLGKGFGFQHSVHTTLVNAVESARAFQSSGRPDAAVYVGLLSWLTDATPVKAEKPTIEALNQEPTGEQIAALIAISDGKETWYTAHEKLREQAYGRKPPDGYQSWGDYWKSY